MVAPNFHYAERKVLAAWRSWSKARERYSGVKATVTLVYGDRDHHGPAEEFTHDYASEYGAFLVGREPDGSRAHYVVVIEEWHGKRRWVSGSHRMRQRAPMAQRPNKWLDPTKTRIIILVDCDVVACGSSRVNHRSLGE